MRKDITETHPSLNDKYEEVANDWGEFLGGYPEEEVQKHTVDKAVLKEVLNKFGLTKKEISELPDMLRRSGEVSKTYILIQLIRDELGLEENNDEH